MPFLKTLVVTLFFLTLFQPTVLLPEESGKNQLDVITYDGIINPVASEFILQSIREAEEDHSEALVIQLDTPGGLDASMRLIVKRVLAAEVPVIVYVSPPGARAASAGVFILEAAHFAVMASGTNAGAAHPVSFGGGEMTPEMSKKVENDAAAFIRSIAERRGRNAEWAERAVRESVSISEKEALSMKVIDWISPDLNDLALTLDGKIASLEKGKKVLRTRGASLNIKTMGQRLRLLNAIIDPNVAYVLMLLGVYGILFELYNPGLILPGIVGGICLILAFYSFQTLPINYAGLLLIILGVILFLTELTVPSYGLLTMGGTISLLLGSLLLYRTGSSNLSVSWSMILSMTLATFLFFFAIIGKALVALKKPVLTGMESLINEKGFARTDLNPKGIVLIRGELWNAISEEPIQANEEVVVVNIEGLVLKVKKYQTNLT
ncbi:MAG: nodulation protein NfeD [Nitrospiria bacterium]